MKTDRMITSVLVITILLICIQAGSAIAQDYNPEGLEIKIALEKTTFLVDEPIYIEVKETNVTDEPVVTSPMSACFPPFFEFVLRSDNGEILNYRGGSCFIDVRSGLPGKILNAGETQYRVYRLLTIFGMADKAHTSRFYLPPANYKITAVHHTRYRWLIDYDDIRKNLQPPYSQEELERIEVDKGTIESETLSFEIVEPTGREKEIQNQILRAARINSSISGRTPVEVIPIYEQIVNDDFDSVYETYAYKRLLFYYLHSSDFSKTIDVYGLMDRYKNSFFCSSLLREIPGGYEKSRYESLISRYPGTKLAEYAGYDMPVLEERAQRIRYKLKDIINKK